VLFFQQRYSQFSFSAGKKLFFLDFLKKNISPFTGNAFIFSTRIKN